MTELFKSLLGLLVAGLLVGLAIVVGSVIFIIVLCLLPIFLWVQKRRFEEMRKRFEDMQRPQNPSDMLEDGKVIEADYEEIEK